MQARNGMLIVAPGRGSDEGCRIAPAFVNPWRQSRSINPRGAEPATSGPGCFGRQGHQDRLDVATRLETEGGAAIVQQVELDVAAAADELVAPVLVGPGLEHVMPDDPGIGVEKGEAHVAGESEVLLPIAGPEIVEEDAADA